MTKPLPTLWEQSAADVVKLLLDSNPAYFINEMLRYDSVRSAARNLRRGGSPESVQPPLDYEGTLIRPEDTVQLCVVERGDRLLSGLPTSLNDAQERIAVALLWLLRQEAQSFGGLEIDPMGCVVVRTSHDALWEAYEGAMRHVHTHGDGPRSVVGEDLDACVVYDWSRDGDVYERLEEEGLRTLTAQDAFVWAEDIHDGANDVKEAFDEDFEEVFDASGFENPHTAPRPVRGAYPRARFIVQL
ncbi:MAG: hypothetical protein CMI16_12815 [Opitutaceae bacterium]|nr:hypothetical protein [Opitutaceae bacterium]